MVSAVPTYSRGASSVTQAENCAESATTAMPHSTAIVTRIVSGAVSGNLDVQATGSITTSGRFPRWRASCAKASAIASVSGSAPEG